MWRVERTFERQPFTGILVGTYDHGGEPKVHISNVGSELAGV